MAGAQVGIAKITADPNWYGFRDATRRTSRAAPTRWSGRRRSLLIQSISTYNGFNETLHDTVQVYLTTPQFTSFTLFSWMTNSEGPCQWVTGDSVFGELHSNGLNRHQRLAGTSRTK